MKLLAILFLSGTVQAKTIENTCRSDKDCALLSVCNVIFASSKAVAQANDQYEHSKADNVYYSKNFKDCKANYTQLRPPPGIGNTKPACLNKQCVLKIVR